MIKKQNQVIKSTGERVDFSWNKVSRSARRVGATKETAGRIADCVEKDVRDGTTTLEIWKRIKQLLEQESPRLAMKFDLPRAMRRLGPTGFPFEKYIAAILKHQGYQIEVGKWVRGKCVRHEVDILASNNDFYYLGECKYHNRRGLKIDLPTTLHYSARFLDLEQGPDILKRVKGRKIKTVLITNTQFTTQAIKYFKCVGKDLWGWRYPAGQGLQAIIDREKLYPITILPSFKGTRLKQAFSRQGKIMAKDVLTMDAEKVVHQLGCSSSLITSLVEEAKQLFKIKN